MSQVFVGVKAFFHIVRSIQRYVSDVVKAKVGDSF